MSEARENVWITLAVLAVVVIAGTLAESAPRPSGADVSAVDRPATSSGQQADDPTGIGPQPADLDAQIARFCAAHRDGLARAQQLELAPADDTDAVVTAALRQLVVVTGAAAEALDPDTFDADVHGDGLHPRLAPLRDAVDAVGQAASQLLDRDDADADAREAFLLAQFDDASYLEPLNADRRLAAAVVASPACSDLPWQPRR